MSFFWKQQKGSEDSIAEINKFKFFLGQGYLDLFNLITYCGGEENLLKEAVLTNNINLVYAVIESGFDTDTELEDSDDGTTALMIAIRECSSEMVKYLLAADAEIHIRNEEQDTPLSIAKINHRQDVIQMLKQVHEGEGISYFKDYTPVLTEKKYIKEIEDGIKFLKENDYSLNDLDGPVPLNEAIKQDNMYMVDAFLDSGIDVNICDFDENENAYSLAKKLGNRELLAKIIRYGGNVNNLEYDDSEYDDV